MKTSPLKQCLWTLLAAVLLAVPLYRLTMPAAAVSVRDTGGVPEKAENEVACLLAVRCVSAPEKLVVRLGGKVVFDLAEESEFSPRMEKDVLLPLRKKMEFHLEAVWPETESGDQPITVSIEPDGMEERSATRWSHGRTLNDIFSFSW